MTQTHSTQPGVGISLTQLGFIEMHTPLMVLENDGKTRLGRWWQKLFPKCIAIDSPDHLVNVLSQFLPESTRSIMIDAHYLQSLRRTPIPWQIEWRPNGAGSARVLAHLIITGYGDRSFALDYSVSVIGFPELRPRDAENVLFRESARFLQACKDLGGWEDPDEPIADVIDGVVRSGAEEAAISNALLILIREREKAYHLSPV